MENTISDKILAWFGDHGRHDLPWQQDKSPYNVWVSEIMLQQTQVATVIPYFESFMSRFPVLEDLATAIEDEVLHQWTGLGYYARARNLHKTAQYVHEHLQGVFPDTVEALMELPGIGRSTAGAIVATAMNKRAVILDGNVKRVLSRFHCVQGWPEQSTTNKKLWEIAEAYTPENNCADYNQALMDLGASLCSRANPACGSCPLQSGCEAFMAGRTAEFPHKKPRKKLPVKATTMLILQSPDTRKVLLEKRPPQGIWGGLWSLPELDNETDAGKFLQRNGYRKKAAGKSWQTIRHTFSHFHLDITPLLIPVKHETVAIKEDDRWHWYDLKGPIKLGLAAPVKKLLQQLGNT